ncbi:MAG: pectate lyase [Verrucomicrobiae bacterium]|nr:pectate lyase [Verrucomicrobiae bacterium]
MGWLGAAGAGMAAILGMAAWGADRPGSGTLMGRPEAWFASVEAVEMGGRVLSHQTARGDWPKNMNTAAAFAGPGRPERGTFDNGATVGEIRFLARLARVTGERRFREGVERGLSHILDAQYPNGGWPQSHPAGPGYGRHITFNDGTMVGLMELMREVSRSEDFGWLGQAWRGRAAEAFERGVECILKCQVRVGGRLTVWCAQHDEITLEPRPARTYELASLSGGESAGILLLLMSLEERGARVEEAIRAGVEWYERVKIRGIRVETRDGDRRVVEDAGAPPLWARFYELDTLRPLFAGRDGVARYRLADIEQERRAGYAWYGNWGERVLRAAGR